MMPMVPTGRVVPEVNAERRVDLGLFEHAVLDHRLAPLETSSAGWKANFTLPGARAVRAGGRPEANCDVPVVPAGVHLPRLPER